MLYCYYGHYKKDCPKLKIRTRSGIAKDDSDRSETVLSVIIGDFRSDYERIPDSRCSYHVCIKICSQHINWTMVVQFSWGT